MHSIIYCLKLHMRQCQLFSFLQFTAISHLFLQILHWSTLLFIDIIVAYSHDYNSLVVEQALQCYLCYVFEASVELDFCSKSWRRGAEVTVYSVQCIEQTRFKEEIKKNSEKDNVTLNSRFSFPKLNVDTGFLVVICAVNWEDGFKEARRHACRTWPNIYYDNERATL